jgi:hypothetical protein
VHQKHPVAKVAVSVLAPAGILFIPVGIVFSFILLFFNGLTAALAAVSASDAAKDKMAAVRFMFYSVMRNLQTAGTGNGWLDDMNSHLTKRFTFYMEIYKVTLQVCLPLWYGSKKC